jgi:hypothetical protein
LLAEDGVFDFFGFEGFFEGGDDVGGGHGVELGAAPVDSFGEGAAESGCTNDDEFFAFSEGEGHDEAFVFGEGPGLHEADAGDGDVFAEGLIASTDLVAGEHGEHQLAIDVDAGGGALFGAGGALGGRVVGESVDESRELLGGELYHVAALRKTRKIPATMAPLFAPRKLGKDDCVTPRGELGKKSLGEAEGRAARELTNGASHL